jgi:hypothetical protein
VFADWLPREVDRIMVNGGDLLEMVKELSKLPSEEATAYRSMKAHRMHLRVRNAEKDKVTCDSAIAATFLQPQRGMENC